MSKKNFARLLGAADGRDAERELLMQALNQLAPEVGLAPACAALNLNRSSVYREDARRRLLMFPREPPLRPVRLPRWRSRPRSGSNCWTVLNSERFADCSPYVVYATLLDEGRYLGSVRTMYRLWPATANRASARQRAHPVYTKPELLATRPTRSGAGTSRSSKGRPNGPTFHLYVILDIFSRYVVGWMVAPRETAELAEQLIAETVAKHNIPPDTLTLHADRGSSMRSKPVAALLVDLDVTKTHSRPYVSDDNPFSEAQFKTLKYRPDFPDRFGCIEDARTHCQRFFPWYNHSHRHSGIGFMTPATVHYGRATLSSRTRRDPGGCLPRQSKALQRQVPAATQLPNAVWINPPKQETSTTTTQQLDTK